MRDFTGGVPGVVLRRQSGLRAEQGTTRCVRKVPTLSTKQESFSSPNAKQPDVFSPSPLQSPAPHLVPGGGTGWEALTRSLLFYGTPEAAAVPSRATRPVCTRQASFKLNQGSRQAQVGLGHPGSGGSWSRNPKCERWRGW